MSYTCGPYGNFQGGEEGGKYDLVVSTCAWNKTWAPSTLDPCVATSCQVSQTLCSHWSRSIKTVLSLVGS